MLKYQVRRDCLPVCYPSTGRKTVCSVVNLPYLILDIQRDNRVHKVSTIPMRCNLLECSKERGDLWASEVENHLQGCIDLVAAEAVYHGSCLTKFLLKRDHNKKKTTGQRIIDGHWSMSTSYSY